MNAGIFWVALASLLGCFVAFAVASYRHFRDEPTLAHGIVRAATLGCTVGFSGLAIFGGPVSWVWSVASIGLSVSSILLFRSALRATRTGEFHVAFSGSGPDRLTTGGIYAHIRNPFYAAYLVYWAAWAAALGLHWSGLIGLAGFVALYALAVRQEEIYLSGRFGAEYDAYRARTGRFLPRMP